MRCHGNVKARKGCSQNLIVVPGSEVQERAWSADVLGPSERAKPLTPRDGREALGSYSASASGNSESSTGVKFPAGMAIILDA